MYYVTLSVRHFSRIVIMERKNRLDGCQALCASRMHYVDHIRRTRPISHIYLFLEKGKNHLIDAVVKGVISTYSHTVKKQAHETQHQPQVPVYKLVHQSESENR